MDYQVINETDVDIDNLSGKTPEQIAEALFSHEAKEACSHQILADADLAASTYIFEILITILVKGIEILSGDLNQADLNKLSEDHILGLNPWFHSIGFSVNVDSLVKNEDLELYEDYYCKILIRDKLHENFFEHRKYTNNYHFLLNGPFLNENEAREHVNDLCAVFIKENNTVFRITFDFYKPPVILANNTKLL